MTKKPLSGIALYKNRREASLRLSLPHRGRGTALAVDRVLSSALQMRLSFSHTSLCLSYRLCPLRPFGAPSPRGDGYEMRIPSFKKAARHPCEAILSPSTVIPSEAEGSLLHCRHMHTCALTQTTSWCFLFRLSLAHGLPVCKKAASTSALMIRKKDDSLTSSFTPLCRVVPL